MPTGAMTLLEATKTQKDGFNKGVIQTYASSYHPMIVMPMAQAVGGRWAWDLEYQLPNTTGAVGTRGFNANWTSTRAAISPFSDNIRIYGGQIQIDRAIQEINPNKVAQERLSQIKARARLWTIDFFEGPNGTQMRGIKDWLDNEVAFAGQTVNIGTASTCSVLLTDHLDQLLDIMDIVPGRTFIYTTPQLGLRIRKLARGNNAAGDIAYQNIFTPNQWGFFAGNYNGVPVVPLKDGKGTSLLSADDGDGECAVVYCVTYGPEQLTGFQQGLPKIIPLTQADVYNYFNFEHYVSYAPQAIRCIGRLRYVTNSQ